mmetsp:Transcript_118651/g.230957  ORF Transcript_118651/g.230957 Transcript_118651/m.230957 type:complete len:110 (-) Transcript_118651:113-442(-)
MRREGNGGKGKRCDQQRSNNDHAGQGPPFVPDVMRKCQHNAAPRGVQAFFQSATCAVRFAVMNLGPKQRQSVVKHRMASVLQFYREVRPAVHVEAVRLQQPNDCPAVSK